MQKIQNYTKAAAAFLILFFCYDLLHRTQQSQVIPPGTSVVVSDDTVTHVTPTGNTTTYVPPEGSVTVIHTTAPVKREGLIKNTVLVSTGTTGTVVMIIKDRGWCKAPGVALVYSDAFLLQLDLKFGYYQRFSATIGVNKKFINVGVYRHVDDLIKLRNLEVGAVGGIGYDGDKRYGASMRLNL